jgi:GT2 family glycosyltransferase
MGRDRSITQPPCIVLGITTRNRAHILPKAIASALSQECQNIQTAVWDDGSSDETRNLRSRFPQVAWQRSERGVGLIAARNALMRVEDADYYVSLDDDAWFMTGDEVATAVAYLEANPRVAAVALDVLSPDRPFSVARTIPRPVHMFTGCGHVLRLSAVKEAGYYSESPDKYGGEEKDLCLRLLDLGWEISLLAGVHVWHDKTLVARDRAAQHLSGVCNDLYLTAKRCPMPHVLWVLPYRLFSHLRVSARYGLLRPGLAGVRMFLKHVLSALRSRQPVSAATFFEFIRRSRAPQ